MKAGEHNKYDITKTSGLPELSREIVGVKGVSDATS